MAAKVEIIIESVDKSSKNIGKIDKAFTQFSKTMSSRTSVAMQKYNAEQKKAAEQSKKLEERNKALKASFIKTGAAIVAVAIALKKGFEFAEQGAQIQLVEERFDRLAISVGTTAEALTSQLGAATRGMLSDFEAVKLASELMSLGLANSGAETTRLTGIVADLGLDMNQLVLTMTNMTTMRFDALGIRVDGFKQKVKELEEQGLSAADAFQEAFLRQAEEQILLLGSAADTAAGQFKILRNNLKNSTDELKKWASTLIGPVVSATNAVFAAQDLYNTGLEEGIFTQTAIAGVVRDAEGNYISLADGLRLVSKHQADLAEETRRADIELKVWNQSLVESNSHLGDWGHLIIETTGEIRKFDEETGLLIQTTGDLSEAFADTSVSIEDANLGLEGMISKFQEMIEFSDKGGLVLQEFVNRLGDMANAGEDVGEGFDALAELEEEFTKGTQEAIDTVARLQGLPPAFVDSLITASSTMQDINDLLDEVDGKAINAGVNIDVKLSGPGADFLTGSVTIPGGDADTGFREVTEGFETGLAHGGTATAGQSFLVGELGPEIFTPGVTGTVTPNNKINDKIGNTFNIEGGVNVFTSNPVDFYEQLLQEIE